MSRLTDEDIDRIAEAVVAKLTGHAVSEVHIHNPVMPSPAPWNPYWPPQVWC